MWPRGSFAPTVNQKEDQWEQQRRQRRCTQIDARRKEFDKKRDWYETQRALLVAKWIHDDKLRAW